jgi:DNA-binding response OmpR family regulator
MVTARDKLDDKIKGYESGADFYLAKPVDPQELLAVVNAFSRRLAEEIDIAGALKCDSHAMTLTGPEGSVPLTHSEVVVLSALAKAPGRILERWQLMEAAGNGNEAVSNTSLEVRLAGLRKKLASVSEARPVLQSIRNVGYKLCVPVIVN